MRDEQRGYERDLQAEQPLSWYVGENQEETAMIQKAGGQRRAGGVDGREAIVFPSQ